MDHRCLYGHRVPATFSYAIQSQSCPTCGAPTVTLSGYRAARKLTTEVGLEAVAAFNAVRVLESEWALTPLVPGDADSRLDEVDAPEPGAIPPGGARLAAGPAREKAAAADDVPEPTVTAASVQISGAAEAQPNRRLASGRGGGRAEPRIVVPTDADPILGGLPAPVAQSARFDVVEEDFFKSN